MKHKLKTKRKNRQIHNLAGGFKTPISIIDKSKQKISKDIGDMSSTTNKLIHLTFIKCPDDRRMYLFLKNTWNIQLDRLHFWL